MICCSGRVVPHVQQEMQVQGGARMHIDITSKGRSAHELVSALSGDVSLGLDNVLLPRRYVEYLSADGQQPSAAGDAYTALEIDGAVASQIRQRSRTQLLIRFTYGPMTVVMTCRLAK